MGVDYKVMRTPGLARWADEHLFPGLLANDVREVRRDLARRQSQLQLGDSGGSGFGAAKVERFEVRQAGEVFDAVVAQTAARERESFELLPLRQIRRQQVTQ